MFMAKSPQKLFYQKTYNFNSLADSLQHLLFVRFFEKTGFWQKELVYEPFDNG